MQQLDEEEESLVIQEKQKEGPKKRYCRTIDWSKVNWPFWNEISIVLAALFVAESSRGLVAASLALYVENVGDQHY